MWPNKRTFVQTWVALLVVGAFAVVFGRLIFSAEPTAPSYPPDVVIDATNADDLRMAIDQHLLNIQPELGIRAPFDLSEAALLAEACSAPGEFPVGFIYERHGTSKAPMAAFCRSPLEEFFRKQVPKDWCEVIFNRKLVSIVEPTFICSADPARKPDASVAPKRSA